MLYCLEGGRSLLKNLDLQCLPLDLLLCHGQCCSCSGKFTLVLLPFSFQEKLMLLESIKMTTFQEKLMLLESIKMTTQRGRDCLEVGASDLIQNDLPQSLVACPDHLSARFISGGFEQVANGFRKIGSYADDSQTMAVQELEGWVPLRQFLKQEVDTEISLVHICVMKQDDPRRDILGSHISKSCFTASYV